MKIKALCAPILLALVLAPSVYADIYKCVGADGHVTFSNVANKSCKKLSLDPPSPQPATAKPAAKAATPSSFPRVDESAQKSRDNDRRRILEDELAAEQRSLEQARKELSEQESVRLGGERNYQKLLDRVQPYKDKVALHERNIEAIQSELSRLR